MGMVLRWLSWVAAWLGLVMSPMALAADAKPDDATARLTAPADGPASPLPRQTIEVFVRDGCPPCADAKAFLQQLQQERPGLTVRLHAVDTNAAARDRLV